MKFLFTGRVRLSRCSRSRSPQRQRFRRRRAPRGTNGQIAFARFNPDLGDTQVYVVNPDGTRPAARPGADRRRRVSPVVPGRRPHRDLLRLARWRLADHQPRRQNVPRHRRAVPGAVQPVRTPVARRDAAPLRDVQRGRKPERHPHDPLVRRRWAHADHLEPRRRRRTRRLVAEREADRLRPVRHRTGDSEGLFVVNTNGTGLKQIMPPTCDPAVRSAAGRRRETRSSSRRHVTPDVHSSIWVVHADGSGLHEINVQPASACGGANADPDAQGCNEPTWSPDGTMIAFVRSHSNDVDGEIYTVNLDGTGLTQVTHAPGANYARLGHASASRIEGSPARALGAGGSVTGRPLRFVRQCGAADTLNNRSRLLIRPTQRGEPYERCRWAAAAGCRRRRRYSSVHRPGPRSGFRDRVRGTRRAGSQRRAGRLL